MAEHMLSTQPPLAHTRPDPSNQQSKPAEIEAACRADLHCRISALQAIVTQLLTENERLRHLVSQQP